MSERWEPWPALAQKLTRGQWIAAAAGAVLLLLSVIGAFWNPSEFFRSYLFGYMFWLGIALGSMALVMTQYLTAGAWGVVSRRTFEAASRTLPVLAVLFIPVIFGIPALYPWAHPDLVGSDEILHHRAPYMNTQMFILRACIYFAVWLTFMFLLNRWSRQEDEQASRQDRLEALSAPGLIVYVFTVTFSAVDWAESLFAHWYSTMWGFLFVGGQGLAAMCFGIIALSLLARVEPLSEAVRKSHLHDLGKLTLMFVMLYAYFAFSQLLIVWSGNLASEIPWYLPRWVGSWKWVGVLMALIEFFIPFALLLSRRLKRNWKTLSGIAALLLIARLVDLYWVVVPAFERNGLHLHWLQLSVPLALGCLWLAAFLWQLKARPLLPLGAPNLEEALQHGD